jgi:hypothetical protein
MASNDRLDCLHCGERIGAYEPIRVINAEGRVVAATTAQVHAAPDRYRSLVLHEACASARENPTRDPLRLVREPSSPSST